MNHRLSHPVSLRVQGPLACFTRPEMKVERVSYDVMTPSAARGILEAILWKPEMFWSVERIDVLAPIRWTSLRRNEISQKVSLQSVTAAMAGGPVPRMVADDRSQRQQRAALLLRDVDYIIHARIGLTPKYACPEDGLTKYREMFVRRASKGQHHHTPYLGCREFSADVELAGNDAPQPHPVDLDLGWLFYDFDYSTPAHGGDDASDADAKFFRARLDKGVLHVPPAWSVEVRS